MSKLLSTHTLELVMAELILDYLTDTQTGQADAAVAKRLMDYIEEPARPVLVITAKEEGSKGSARRVIKINPVLCTWAQSEKPGAAINGQATTQDAASQMMRAIYDRLRDKAAFQTWLNSLDSARREGWSLQKIIHEGMAPIMRPDPETRAAYYGLDLVLHLFCPPQVSA